MLAALLPALMPGLTAIINRFIPDEAERARAEAEMQAAIVAREAEIQRAASDIIRTEAASSHWLAANWRPITALVFVGLVVARWMGWTAPNMTEAEYIAIYDIIQVMIGGYVISRGAEKVIPHVAQALRR